MKKILNQTKDFLYFIKKKKEDGYNIHIQSLNNIEKGVILNFPLFKQVFEIEKILERSDCKGEWKDPKKKINSFYRLLCQPLDYCYNKQLNSFIKIAEIPKWNSQMINELVSEYKERGFEVVKNNTSEDKKSKTFSGFIRFEKKLEDGEV